MPQVMYKNKIINIDRISEESDKEFHLRKWFVFRSLPDEYFQLKDTPKMIHALTTSIALSKVHVKHVRHNCVYDEDVMKKLKTYDKNLYIYG